ncbi:Zn-dependent hydrolase [Acidianus manzaensis]|nr:Zn-dependent hydrolase [Acidianus manzaensis]
MFKVGDHGEVPGAEVFWMRDFNKWYRLYFYSFLLDTTEGYILINTGLPDDLSLRNKFLHEWAGSNRCNFSFNEDEKIENILNKINLTVGDISHIVITPFQDYTIGRLNLFKNAYIYFSQTGWYHDVVNPLPSPFLNRDIYFPKIIRNYLFEEAWNRIKLVENQKVIDDIYVKWIGCHHRSSMLIKLYYNNKKICISDSAFLMANYEQNIPIGIAENVYECIESYKYMQNECNIVIPAYDPENINRYMEYFPKI